MALDLSVFAADVEAIIADMPATLVMLGQTVSCMAGDIQQTETLDVPGFTSEVDMAVECLRIDFDGGTLPGIGATGTVDGVSVRVASKMLTPDGKVVRLGLRRV